MLNMFNTLTVLVLLLSNVICLFIYSKRVKEISDYAVETTKRLLKIESDAIIELQAELHEMKSFLEFNGYKRTVSKRTYANRVGDYTFEAIKYKRFTSEQIEKILSLQKSGMPIVDIAKVMKMKNARIYSLISYEKSRAERAAKMEERS